MHPDDAPFDRPAEPPPEEAIVPVIPVAQHGPEEAVTATPPPPRPLPPPIRRLPLPGFWLSVLLCVLLVFITQLLVPVAVVVVLLVLDMLTAPNIKEAINGLGNQAGMKAFQAKIMLPLLAVSQATLLALGVFALRLLAGRDWRRAVAVRRPSLTHLVVALVGFPALPVLAGGIYHIYSLGQKDKLLPGLAELPALFLALLAVVLLVSLAWLVCRLAGWDWKRALAHGSLGTQLLAGVPGAVAALLLSWGIYLLISPYIGRVTMLEELNKGMEELVEQARDWPWVLAVLVIGLSPGLAEETWCRAFLGRGLLGQYGVVVGVVLASFFFGAIHVLPGQGFMAVLMGILLHYTYVTTRSLAVPMLLHFLNNAMSVAGYRVLRAFEKIDTAPGDISLWVYWAAALLLLAAGWALFQTRARLVTLPDSPLPPWQPDFPGVALPPPNSGTIVTHPWPSLLTIVLVLAATACFWATFGLELAGLLPKLR